MQPATAIGRKNFELFGKLLFEHYPQVAEELSVHLKGETDLSRLAVFFSLFCNVTETPDFLLKGALFKSYLIDQRRLFIGAILVIYRPHTRALAVSMANLLHMHRQQMSRMIEETKTRYAANCEDFKTNVDLIVEKIREV